MSRQTELEHLKLRVHVELAQAQNLDQQLDALVQIMAEVVDAERASLFLHDPQSGELYSRVAMGVTSGELRVLCDEGVAGAVFTTGESIVVDDVSLDPRFNAQIDEIAGFTTRSLLAVPLRTADGATIGVTEALNKRRGAFSEADVNVMEALTAEAALILRNTLRLEDAVSASRREARFVEVVSELSSEIQLGPLLQRIMEAITRLLDAERSTLFLNDEKTGTLFTEVGQGLGAQSIRIPNDQGIAGAVFTTGRSVNIPYAYADLRFNPDVDRRTGFFTRSILCVPVVNKEGKVIGVTQVLNKRGGVFSDKDEAQLRAFTAQIAIGLENAQLFDDVQRMKQYNDRILASMSSGVVTFDDQECVVTCNAAAVRILRESSEALAGRRATDVFGEANAWIIDKLRRAGAVGAVDSAVDADLVIGTDRVAVNLTAMPLVNAQGERLGAMLLFDDISGEKRLRSTLSRYVDASVADRLIEADAELLEGRSGIATILFSDIAGFTPLAERLGAPATVAFLNDYMTRMVACIEQERGTLDKFIADEIMAVFGVPYAEPDDADRAVRAGIAMLRALAELNVERRAAGEKALAIRIGINTGDVFSGNVGSPRRMDFTVMGDGVNLASRLESGGRYYGTALLISEFTLKALKATYRTREVDLVVVKGKSEPVAIHEVLDHYDADAFPHMIDALAAYRDGLGLYRQRRWAEAAQAFERVLALHPGDGLAATYEERCRRFAARPPAKTWDGVWRLAQK